MSDRVLVSLSHAIRTICLFSVMLAAPLAADEESGRITLNLGGERLEFPLNAGHSDWSGSGSYAKVTIITQPTDAEIWLRFKTLALAFDLLSSSAQAPELSLLRRTEDAAFERLFGRADRGGLVVDITEKNLSSNQLHVSGTFAGNLGRTEDFGRTIDLDAPMAVSGTFAVILDPVR